MNRDVTVVIPTIPGRAMYLTRAVRSVMKQTELPASIICQVDKDRRGAPATRNAGMAAVTTEWTAFLDDDDELLEHHLEFLLDRAEEFDLDLVWGWFAVAGGEDPFPVHRGRQFDPASPHIFPITVLCRTSMLRHALLYMGGFQEDPDGTGDWEVQDKPIWLDVIVRQGANHMAFPDHTWVWYHHGKNTSGVASRR